MYTIRLLGGAAIEGPSGRLAGRGVQRARIALLALLVTAPRKSASRDRVMGILWPESDTERARALLRDSVYRLREALGAGAVIAEADDIRLDTDRISCDVCDFEEAVGRKDLAAADRLYAGPFLDGFFLSGSSEFDRWVESERSRLAEVHAQVLETLAAQYSGSGDLIGAVRMWRRRASSDPYNSRVALRLMESLDAAGDRTGALHHGAAFADLMKKEFGALPDSGVAQCISRLRGERSHELYRQLRHPVPPSALLNDVEQKSETHPAPLEPSSFLPAASVSFVRKYRIAAAIMLVSVAVVLGALWYAGKATAGGLDRDRIAILPFRVSAPDSSHNHLRDGIVDLISAQLMAIETPRAVDTRVMLGAYRRVVGSARAGDLDTPHSLALARKLGAAKLLVGELVITSTGSAISARLLSVPSGRVLAAHSEAGRGDELVLITRLTASLIAKSFGEKATRLSGLSDSTEAVRAYLSGMRQYRSGRARTAFNELGRALEIDPSFAPAAFWRAMVAFDMPYMPVQSRHVDSVAWSLRRRLNWRDSLALVSLPFIRQKLPEPPTGIDLIHSIEAAAYANPDRPEIWQNLGRILEEMGAQAGISRHLERAIAALDSAIALDSTFAPALAERLHLAVITRDTSGIRKFAALFTRANADSVQQTLFDWMVARALGDTKRLPALLDRLAIVPDPRWASPLNMFVYRGIPSLDDAERAANVRIAHSSNRPGFRIDGLAALYRIAVIRGHPRLALAFLDSLRDELRWFPYGDILELGLMGPGYDSAAWMGLPVLKARIDSVPVNPQAVILCRMQLWLVTHDDTTTARQSVARIRQLVRKPESTGEGRLDLCPSLIEAAIEQQSHLRRSAALYRVAGIILRGTFMEIPHNVAPVLVARWLESQGDERLALTIIRRIVPVNFQLAGPAVLRMEGHLAAKLGDNDGAIRAYEQFLTIRPTGDPGPIADEVRMVRSELSRLQEAGSRRLTRTK